MVIKSFCREPVIKVVKGSDFTNEKRQFLYLPYKECLSPLSPISRPTMICHYPLPLYSRPFHHYCPEKNKDFFVHYPYNLFIPRSYSPFQSCLSPTLTVTIPVPHSCRNSNLFEDCLNFPWHNPFFCTFAHNGPSFWRVFPSLHPSLIPKLISIYQLDSERKVS